MNTRLDIHDWSVRRGMLLCGMLVAASVAVSLCAPMYIVAAVVTLLPLTLVFGRMRRLVPLFCVATMIVGLLSGVSYRVKRVEPLASLDGCADTVKGIVVDCPRDGNMYTVRVTDSDLLPADSRVLLYCSDLVAPSLYDEVTATVEYHALYDSQKYHRADGVYLQAFPTTFGEDCVHSYPVDHFDWRVALRPFRSMLTRNVTSMLSGDEGGLLTAVCFGDKSRLSVRVNDAFRASGLSHLLAVSGLHMSVIAGGMLALLRILRVKRLKADIITAAVILLFMWIVEFTPSVTRSGVMYLILLLGRMTRFQSDSLNSLGLALTLILTVSPSSLYDIGLWLSFVATVGVLCVTPRLYAPLMRPFECAPRLLHKPIKWFIGSVSVSVGCTLPLLPLMLIAFGEVSLISPVANLFTVLPSGWMTILGCVGSLLSVVPIIGFVGKGLIVLAGLLAKYLIVVSELLSAIPGAVMRPNSLWFIIFAAGAGLILSVAIVRVPFRKVCLTLCVMLCALILAFPLHSHLTGGRYAVALATDSRGTVVLVDGEDGTTALMNDAASVYTLRSLMDKMRVDELSTLVVNECKTSHEAYLADLKREFPSLSVVCVEDVGDAEWLDYPLLCGGLVRLDDRCSLEVVDENNWMLGIGRSRFHLSMSRDASTIPEFKDADVVLVYAESLGKGCLVTADAVFCSVDKDKRSLDEAKGLYTFAEDAPVFIATVGDGEWKWMRRVFDVLA